MHSDLFHLQFHDWGALEQGTEPPTARRAPQHKWLPTAPECIQGVCVFTAVGVHLGWVKCRALILSMGYHTWPHVTSLHFTFLLSPGKTLLTLFLFQKWLGSPFPEDVWAWWLQLLSTPCEALPSVWISFPWQYSQACSHPCCQRWAQIHQNVFKIKIQNTAWKNLFKYKYQNTAWENVFKYKYSILYFENTQNTFEIGHQWSNTIKACLHPER